jgi:hypothetical protein
MVLNDKVIYLNLQMFPFGLLDKDEKDDPQASRTLDLREFPITLESVALPTELADQQ